MICMRSYGYLSTGRRVLAFCFLDDVANKELCFSHYTQETLFIFAYANTMYNSLFHLLLVRNFEAFYESWFIYAELEDGDW
jgi:hypothetical protein